jgi:iron complex transport system substrate-binding protein
MRIVSLVPHATELLFALGLGDDVVGVTHECDHPERARTLPKITGDRLHWGSRDIGRGPSARPMDARSPGLSAAQIDTAVRERTQRGEAIYTLDEAMLAELEPDLIVTQELCPVCAVSHDEVVAVAERIESCPKVIALDPKTLGESIGDIRTVAQATGSRDAALDLVARQSARIDRVRLATRKAEHRPTVVAIEWFDPVFIAGHWTPQLIELAGGIDALGLPGERSERSDWEIVAAAQPEVIVCIPCGYDAQRSLQEAELFTDELRAIGAKRIVALDASGYFSRPGPRLVDGLETLAHALHPELVPDCPGEVLDLSRN